ncbi:MAG TPA: response regulator transcription factor [Euzebyales bacterium]|nr:response regulator transcription factor [Euzebyales bacterium]
MLIVEDERHLASAVQEGLRGRGFAVDVAHDGATGLTKATDHDFDVIVLDILLPRLSGYEVCKRLRAAGVWTPVLMLTAKDGEYDEADALDLGADDYLRKPFSFVVLVARLHALLRRNPRERPAVLQVGRLVLDPGARWVRQRYTDVTLTPREFALLEYLMRNPGRTVSKEELLDHVWGAAYGADPNVVQVYIGYLRRKIDEPFGTTCIETVRGHGYRLHGDSHG